ncbi:hypothetical protein [Capnocytophaga sp. H2931]|uniref:hypothetical protein n=1 Tax=Capnocytophaga sp. H2931 TaxID=1945657 RepID=UPI000BB18048|nr:hypothetical protein [Capnocytophaga sp. H2931]ATA74819.1 hypothetical protein CGC52_04850 [Capnocytophaga sp. H2931]
MRKSLFIIIMGALFFSCNKNNEKINNEENSEVGCCKHLSSSASFSVVDNQGNDLLSPFNEKFDPKNIKIYYKDKNNKLELFDRPNLAESKGFTFIAPEKEGQKYLINVFINSLYIEDKISHTVIDLGYKKYEIKSEFSVTTNAIVLQKIYVDNKLMNFQNNRIVTIVE